MFSPVMMLGTVGASFPSPAEEEEADTISLDEWLIDNKESSFLLKISGESMIDAGIHPGDVVILQRGRKAKTGDIVVAEIDGEWTIKYYEQRGKRVRLIPANKGDASYKPIEPNDEMRIAGVVSAVVRKYA
jgi:repressor LexA